MLGLELTDLLILQFFLVIVLVLSGSLLIALPIVFGLYTLLKQIKKNKPPYHSERLLRFIARPRYFNLFAVDDGGLKSQ